MHLTARRTARIAVVSTAITFTGLIVAVPAEAKVFGRTISYTCQMRGAVDQRADERIKVRLAGAATSRGSAGKAIGLGRISMQVELPGTLSEAVTGPVDTAISGTAMLTVNARQGGRTVNAGWPAAELTQAPSAPGRLSGSFPVPGLLPTAGGAIKLDAGSLALALRSETAGASVTQLVCEPNGETSIASIAVQESPADGRPTPQPKAAQAEPVARCNPPETGFNPAKELEFDKPTDHPTREQIGSPNPYCGQLVGYTNVRKLGAAAPVGGKLAAQLSQRDLQSPEGDWIRIDSYGVTDLHPGTATMLGFGFMPTTVVTEVGQDGVANIASFSDYDPRDPPGPFRGKVHNVAKSLITVGVSSISVNGVPVDPGGRCRADGKVFLQLEGDFPGGTPVYAGGTYRTPKDKLLRIPPFTGCGVGEDLSPLITASTSGEGNIASIFQGQLCKKFDEPQNCNETPLRWIVSPLGTVWQIAAGRFTIRGAKGAVIQCESFNVRLNTVEEVISGTFGRMTMSGAKTCTAPEGAITGSGNVTGMPSLTLYTQDYDRATGVTRIYSPLGQIRFSFRFLDGAVTRTCNISTTAASSWDTYFKNRANPPTFTVKPRSLVVATTNPGCDRFFAKDDVISLDFSDIAVPEPRLSITGERA
ncbi:hypothetical protein [Actinomadura sp. 6N118]|uniref:hypothetical protein n=1 Tax=Actinomadura sp. 6N118 TaxID=3375151 RepID=UPI0037A34C6C